MTFWHSAFPSRAGVGLMACRGGGRLGTRDSGYCVCHRRRTNRGVTLLLMPGEARLAVEALFAIPFLANCPFCLFEQLQINFYLERNCKVKTCSCLWWKPPVRWLHHCWVKAHSPNAKKEAFSSSEAPVNTKTVSHLLPLTSAPMWDVQNDDFLNRRCVVPDVTLAYQCKKIPTNQPKHFCVKYSVFKTVNISQKKKENTVKFNRFYFIWISKKKC